MTDLEKLKALLMAFGVLRVRRKRRVRRGTVKSLYSVWGAQSL